MECVQFYSSLMRLFHTYKYLLLINFKNICNFQHFKLLFLVALFLKRHSSELDQFCRHKQVIEDI